MTSPNPLPLLPHVDHTLHGGDYSPEQWQSDDWAADIALLKQTGGNLVTVGVFSWVRLEPREGDYDFSCLDDFMDLAEREGVHISLSTPSATPPLWMGHRYPEIMRVAEDGDRRFHACGDRLPSLPGKPTPHHDQSHAWL